MGLTAWLAPKVSYRRRDALWWLSGLGGFYVWFVVAWRLAYLPHRDWPPRDDELPHAVYLRESPHVGVWRDGRRTVQLVDLRGRSRTPTTDSDRVSRGRGGER